MILILYGVVHGLEPQVRKRPRKGQKRGFTRDACRKRCEDSALCHAEAGKEGRHRMDPRSFRAKARKT